MTAPTPAPPRRLPSKRLLWWLVPILVILVVAAVLGLRNPRSETPLSPHNAEPNGSRAMAQVLGQQGVTVRTPESADALAKERIGSGTSVVVTRADLLAKAKWTSFLNETAGADRIVLIEPGSTALDALGFPADVRHGTFPADTAAGCDESLAHGLTLKSSGERYAVTAGESAFTTCFRPQGGFDAGGDRAGMLLVAKAEADRPEVVVIGTDSVVRNDGVLEADHAALGLRALGQSDRLVWWNVGQWDVDHANAPPPRWPDWLTPMWIVAVLAVVLLILARGRRLGKLVTEPLPVIVRADETTRARGQLYRRAGDLERASLVLRSATRRRLASYLRVQPDDRTLVPAVAVAGHRDTAEVERLLLGPTPTTEAELSTLAQHLHDLEKEIRPR